MSWFSFGKIIAQGLAKAGGVISIAACFAPKVSHQAYIVRSSTVVKHVLRSFISRKNYGSNIAADLRQRASQSFLKRNASKFPMLAFAGLCLSDDQETEKKVSIGNLVEYLSTNLDQFWKDQIKDEAFPQQFSEYNIGERLGRPSSNAAVYSANYNGNEVALKIMFNYSVPSNETAIFEAFEREYKVLPISRSAPSQCVVEVLETNQNVIMPEHPYVIKLHGKFIDKTPLLHDSVETYPVAVPRSLHCAGYGRNKTMCLVMPKYTCSLREYLQANTLPNQQYISNDDDDVSNVSNVSKNVCISIFHQLLEGVAHLEQNRIAHRDLKSDNILINTCEDGSVQVAITDFGCCLAGEDMRLPYSTTYTDRGGNFALLAPEISTAVPCGGLYLDYSKADAWTCGSIAYEIFNGDNPFYNRLQNVDYNDEDLEGIPLNSGWKLVDSIVSGLLQKNPESRLSACDAATVISLFINAPREWLLFPRIIRKVEVETWLLAFSLTTMQKCRSCDNTRVLPPDLLSNLVFLSRVTPMYIMEILELISELQN